jgi:hypothetical protein
MPGQRSACVRCRNPEIDRYARVLGDDPGLAASKAAALE